MTDKELKKDLNSRVSDWFFRKKLFKRDSKVFWRRSFDDLFIYYRKFKVTEKQLLKVLLEADFRVAVCSNIHKTVFYKNPTINKMWIDVNSWDSGYSYKKTTRNTKYTAEYLDNLYKQIQDDEN